VPFEKDWGGTTMLNDTERDFLSKLNGTEIERDLREITRYERPSGSEGERLAH